MIAKPLMSPFCFTVAVTIISLGDMQIAGAETLDDAIISEFVADNNDGIVDEDGDREREEVHQDQCEDPEGL